MSAKPSQTPTWAELSPDATRDRFSHWRLENGGKQHRSKDDVAYAREHSAETIETLGEDLTTIKAKSKVA